MAEIEASMISNMKSQSTITALVGQRVYDDGESLEGKQPFIRVVNTSDPRAAFTQSAYGGTARLSVYVYAETKAKAREIGRAVMAIYKQFSGTLGDHTVQYVEVSNARTLFGPGDDIRYLVDLVVHYT